MSFRRWAIFLCFCIFVFLMLYGCAPAATPAPAAAAPAAEARTPIPTPTEAISLVPTPDVPVIEEQIVELDWPQSIKSGESDIIRLSLIPDKDGYKATAEFPDHTTQSQVVSVKRTPGYTLFGIARLDGVAFELSPSGDQKYLLPEGETTTWRWSISPKSSGQQRISISLVLRWEPEAATRGSVREALAFSRGLNINVSSFLGMTRAQAASAGFLGLISGSIISLTGFFWRKRGTKSSGAISETTPNASLVMETGANIVLSNEDATLLRALFNHHERLIMEDEFLSGYSGARTFLVRPVLQGGKNEAQTIVKIGPRMTIRQEFENYETFVKDRLPPITARIQRSPVSTAGNSRAALQYTFLAEPGHSPLSLRRALIQNPNPTLISRLFNTFAPHWWLQRSPYTFRLEQEYDSLLPPHLVMEPLPEGTRTDQTIGPNSTPSDGNYLTETILRVDKFIRVEPRADGQSLNLTGSPVNGQPPLRIRWKGSEVPAGTAGRVIHTRESLFRLYTEGLQLCNLPDPLDKLTKILQHTVSGTRSVIHGDLNLENILVGPGNLVWLIDFAQTCEGHPLRDFAHLYTEIIAHVISRRGLEPVQYLQILQARSDTLLTAVEEAARRCQLDTASKDEFNLAAGISCLGALKLNNLNTSAKQLLFLTAAYLLSGY